MTPKQVVEVANQNAPQAAAFTPASISGLVGWYKADAGTFTDTGRTTPAASDGDAVKGLTDQSGQANHLSDASGFTLKLNIQNGLPVLRAAGSSALRHAGSPTLNQPNTLFVVGKALGDNQLFVDGDAVAASENAIFITGGKYSVYGGSTISGTNRDDNIKVLCGVVNGASSSIRVNGAETTGDAGASAMVGIHLGRRSDDALPLSGDICEVLIYNAALDATQIGQVETYLNSRWAVY